MERMDRDIEKRNEARAFAVKTMQKRVKDEIGEAKFRRFISPNNRAKEFVQQTYVKHIVDELRLILETDVNETVYLNISDCNDKFGELLDKVPEDDEGKIKGIEMILKHLTGSFPLKYYNRGDMERFTFEGETDDWGTTFPLPTSIDGVIVCYYYPDDLPSSDEEINLNQTPTVSLQINPIAAQI